MRGPFTRECDQHEGFEVESSISPSGHETLWCGKGHSVKSWYVVGSDGVKVALAHLNTSPQILDAEMLYKLSIDPLFKAIVRPYPDRLCVRGHNDWYLNPDERYRCRACKRENYQRNKDKIAARYQAKKRLRNASKQVTPKKKNRRKKKNV